jgi:hypothetical protein
LTYNGLLSYTSRVMVAHNCVNRRMYEQYEKQRLLARRQRLFYEAKQRAFAKLDRILAHMKNARHYHSSEAIIAVLHCVELIARERFKP